MMRHLESGSLDTLAAIYEDDVELVAVARAGVAGVDGASRRLFASEHEFRAQWVQATRDHSVAERMLTDKLGRRVLPGLSDEIAAAVETLTDLLGCDAVGIRAQRLRGPMCPRFHVDRVPCRMLITFVGEPTEWIAHDEVDWARFADPGTGTVPVTSSGTIRHLAKTSWSLLKGAAWDTRFCGVVHRSPDVQQDRLLLSLDPLFTGNGTHHAPAPATYQ
ncbi:MAG: DUF1826 domain-containing protein [Gammaproteobacteria bacterium]